MADAPRVFLSYSHDSDEHADHVLALADALRDRGIDVILDRYVHPAPDEGWPRWMDRNLDEAQFVLMVCTATYHRRVLSQEEPGKGLGVRWEGSLIYNRIYHDKPSGSRFIPILLLPSSEPAHIPNPVQGHTYYCIAALDLTDPGFEGLLRHLTGQPITPPPDLGMIPTLPPKPRRGSPPDPTGKAAAVGDDQKSATHFRVSDVQVISDKASRTCTLDFRVSNTGGSEVLINRVELNVLDVAKKPSFVMGFMDFSKLYDLDISSLRRFGDRVSYGVAQLVKPGEVDRFGIRLIATELGTGEFRGWRLRPSLATSAGTTEAPEVEVWLPYPLPGLSVRAEREGELHFRLGCLRRKQPEAVSNGPWWNVPHPRNPNFTGREAILGQLEAALAPGTPAALTQAIAGLGGIGKTQTAVEFAYRHHDRYRAVLWVPADTETSLVSGYHELAKVLGLPGKRARNSHEVVAAVCDWLGREPGYLLILDNADDPALVKPYLPPDPRGHVLLTSRAHNFDRLNICRPIALPVLEPDEALAFLRKRTGREGLLDSAEQAAARTLAGELGYLPLALEQAAAYMKEHEETFSIYLDAYHTLRLKLLDEIGPVTGEYPETVRATWKRSFDAVAKASLASIVLLRLSAFFAPDAIPYELLLEGAAVFGEPLASALASSPGGEYGPSRSKRTKNNAKNVGRNNLVNQPLSRWFLCEGYFVPSPKPEAAYALNKLLAPLARHSLVRRNPKARTYSVHRLVQAVLRDELAAADRKEIAERAIKALSWIFPFDADVFNEDPRSERLVPHALTAQGWIESEDLRTPEAARLLHRGGYYLELRARYAEAEPLFRQALAIREATLGPDHADTSATRRHVRQPQQLELRARDAEAEPLPCQAVAIRIEHEATLGPDHADTSATRRHARQPQQSGTERGRLMSVNWWIEKGTRLLSRFVHGDSTS